MQRLAKTTDFPHSVKGTATEKNLLNHGLPRLATLMGWFT
jgi:hypothetical protein